MRPDDRVALVMPMSPEAIAAFYAVAHLGAIVVPIFSGFSASAIAARLDDAAVFVVAADDLTRHGRVVPVKATVDEALVPSVRQVVVHRLLGVDAPWSDARDVDWDDLAGAAVECRQILELLTDPWVRDVSTLAYASGRPDSPGRSPDLAA